MRSIHDDPQEKSGGSPGHIASSSLSATANKYPGLLAMPHSPLPKSCFHVPRKSDVHEDGGVYRAICRRCECDLVRTQASRKWYRSGMFG